MISDNLLHKSLGAAKATLIFKTLSQSFGLTAAILIVRALSEAEYGIYNLLYTSISIITMIASLGISNTLQRFIPEYYQRREFILAHNLYRFLTFLRIITNILILGCFLLLWEQIAPLLKLAPYKPYFMLFTLVIFLHMQRGMLDICLTSFFLQKYSKSIGCLFSAIRVIGYAFIILCDKDLWYAIITDVAAYAIVFISLQILYFKKIPIEEGKSKVFNKTEKKRVSRYAFFYNFNDTGDALLNSYFDNLIIALFMAPKDVGAYSFCVTMVVLIGSVLPIKYFKEIIQTAFFSANANNKFQNISIFFQSLLKLNLIFSLPVFCFLLIYSKDIIHLFFNGKFIEYSSSLCAIFFFFEVLSLPVALVAQLQEKARIIFFSKIFAAYNLIADIILIKFFGIWGAVIATGTAVLGKNLFIYYFIRRDASFKGMMPFYLRAIGFWSCITVLTAIAVSMFENHIMRVVLGTVTFIAVFIIQFRCGYFNFQERKLVKGFTEQKPGWIPVVKFLKII